MCTRKSTRVIRPPNVFGADSPPSSPLTCHDDLRDNGTVDMSRVSVVRVKVRNDVDKTILL